MHKELTEDEKRVREELAKVFPQLKINANKVCGSAAWKWADDLLQLSVEMFLEKATDYQIKVINDGKLEHFITYVMNFQLKRGKTTRWFHTHRKFLDSTRELFVGTYDYDNDPEFPEPFDDEVSILQRCVDEQIAELNPFDKMLIHEKIYNGASFKEMAEKYNINYNSLSEGLKQTLNEIKKTCQHLR